MVSRSMRLAVAVALLAFHAPLATAQLAPTAEERAEGFIALFDGTSTAAWRGYWSEAMPEGWHIVDGVLTKSTAIGDILTREMYSDFELRLDWKLGRGGNAGIFYHGTEAYPKVYWSGPEYQLLDDANAADGRVNDFAFEIGIGDRAAGFGRLARLTCQRRPMHHPAAQGVENRLLRTKRRIEGDDNAAGRRADLDAGDPVDAQKEPDQKLADVRLRSDAGNLQAYPSGGRVGDLASDVHGVRSW